MRCPIGCRTGVLQDKKGGYTCGTLLFLHRAVFLQIWIEGIPLIEWWNNSHFDNLATQIF